MHETFIRQKMFLRHPIRSLFRGWKVQKLNRFLSEAHRAREVQQHCLLAKLAQAAESDFGNNFHFRSIRNLSDFRQRIPITDFEYYRPYIDRVRQGDTTAMFNPGTKLWMFAMTSGTTAAPKYLPVTDPFYREYRASWQHWGTGVYRDYPRLMGMQTLQLSSDWQIERAPSGVPSGNISGLAAETRPAYIRSLFVLPSAVIKIRVPAAKHYAALRLSYSSSRVGMVITANPSTLIEFAKRGDMEKSRLIKDIHDGGLHPDVEVSSSIRHELAPKLRPNRQRARQLERIAERTGQLYPKDVWSDLQLVAVWTGGSVGLYLPQLPTYFGDVPLRDHGISASEGRMSIPLNNGAGAGPLDYTSHFYEFIPEDEYGQTDPTVLEAHELSPDRRYYILLTTSAGLYRYDIADIVQCDGFVGQVPLLKFVSKARNYSSFSGEKLTEHQVVQALRESFAALQIPPCTFTVAPMMTDKPRYQILLTPGVQADCGAELAREAQHRLEALNIEYREKCQSGRIEPLVARVLPEGTWQALRDARSRERGNYEEFKHPCLTNDLAFVDKLPQPALPLGESV
jgi:hypothetical protein